MEVNLTEIPAEVAQARQRFEIIGNAPALIGALTRAVQVAPIDLSVLVIGESGTGKEFFPKIIHAYSPRKHNRYIAVNCGAIPEGTIDSELFGHEKGAFTGAVSDRKGYFEEANGGTIFLDEVAELPLTTQARLLRVLESGEFMKVGSSNVQKTNIRIVAATNVDMAEAVRSGRFREDLYYRLSTVQISVPPLRSRGNDIILLARKFAGDFAERYHTRPISFSDEARSAILHYRWPGNVRQLKNVVEQMALFSAGEQITQHDFAEYVPDSSTFYAPTVNSHGQRSYDQERELLFNMIFRMQGEIDQLRSELHRQTEPHPAPTPTQPEIDLWKNMSKVPKMIGPSSATDITRSAQPVEQAQWVDETPRDELLRTLERHRGNRRDAARELGISERTLYRRIKEYGLD